MIKFVFSMLCLNSSASDVSSSKHGGTINVSSISSHLLISIDRRILFLLPTSPEYSSVVYSKELIFSMLLGDYMQGRLHIEIESSFEKLDCCRLSLRLKLFVLGVIASNCFICRPVLLFLPLFIDINDKFCVLFFLPLLPMLLFPLLGKLAMDILSM